MQKIASLEVWEPGATIDSVGATRRVRQLEAWGQCAAAATVVYTTFASVQWLSSRDASGGGCSRLNH